MYALLTIWIVIEWLLRIVALFVVPRNRKPTSGMAWLMLIFELIDKIRVKQPPSVSKAAVYS